jgi:hypothetical protein
MTISWVTREARDSQVILQNNGVTLSSLPSSVILRQYNFTSQFQRMPMQWVRPICRPLEMIAIGATSGQC